MSDYTKVYDGAALDSAEATLAGADFDVDFAAIETAVATKTDKVSGHTTNSIGLVDVNGNLISSEVLIDTDGTLAGDSDSSVPTEKAVKTYVDNVISFDTAVTPTVAEFDFTIPAGAKRIVVSHFGLSSNGTSGMGLRLGDAGGIETTGYAMAANQVTSSATYSSWNNIQLLLFRVFNASTTTHSGTWTLDNVSGNTWVCTGVGSGEASTHIFTASGYKTLSDTLTTLRVRTANGIDLFDAGTLNIMVVK